jgi:hypothetical protein
MRRLPQRFPIRPSNHWQAGFRAGVAIAALYGLGLLCIWGIVH